MTAASIPCAGLSSVKPFRKAVFVVDIQLRVGNHPGYGNTAFVIQLLQSGDPGMVLSPGIY